ncbi:MAG: FAD-binding oxidoreductase [Culicoidibacterales bacterium]
MSNGAIIRRFYEVLEENQIKTSPVALNNYAYDASPFDAYLPSAVLQPKTVEQVSQIVKICNENKQAIIVRGSGSNLCGATIPSTNEVVMDMKHFNEIEEVDIENLTMTVGAGCITLDIAQKADIYGLMYPPDPGSIKISTIGGNIAENSGGLRGLKYGVTQDYILGLEVVMANGDIIQTGGKLTKDVAGYNLTQLIIGSEGTLGIVTKAILKLIPKPKYKKTATAYFDSLGAAGDVVSDIIAHHIIPATLEIIDQVTMEVVENHAHIGLDTSKAAFLLIEQDGTLEQVETEMEQIIKICAKHGGITAIAKNEEEALEISAARRNCLGALSSLSPTTLLEDATVPRSRVGDFLREVQKISEKHNVEIYTFGHAGDGNMHPTAPCNIKDEVHFKRVEQAFEEIFEVAVSMGGTITGEHGVGKLKAPYLPLKAKNSLYHMLLIKKALDPNNIFNPAIMFERRQEHDLEKC